MKLMRRFTHVQLWGALWLIFFACQVTAAVDDIKGNLPVLKTVGVVPVQVQHTVDFPLEWNKPLSFIEAKFADVVRNTERFRVLNDEVVTDLWRNQAGRKELMDRFEMDAFLSLTVTPRQDVIRFVVRIISPDLEANYLVEEVSQSQVWLVTSEESVIEGFLKDLTFRLINRLPVDVFVTSLQGSYITLSGGESQNIFPDNTVTLYDTQITAVHPANGSWLTYAQKKLGTARVIESKRSSSVAELTMLSYEGAVSLGSGAKIDALNSRVRFHRTASEPEFRSPDNTVLVSPDAPSAPFKARAVKEDNWPKVASSANVPIIHTEKPASQEATVPTPPTADTPPISAENAVDKVQAKDDALPEVKTIAAAAPDEKIAQNGAAVDKAAAATPKEESSDKQATKEPEPKVPAPPAAEENKGKEAEQAATPEIAPIEAGEIEKRSEPGQEQQEVIDNGTVAKDTLLGPLLSKFDEKEAAFSHHMLKVGSPAATSTRLPSWIINEFSARGRVYHQGNLSADHLAYFRLGPTSKGHLSGLGLESRLLIDYTLERGPFGARKLSLGPLVHAESTGITSEKFGGADFLSIGVSGEIEGDLVSSYNHGEGATSWRLHGAYLPLAFGSIGINGKKKSISALSSLAADGTIFLPKKNTSDFQWGGSIGLAMSSAKGGSTSLFMSEFLLGVSLR